MFKQVQNFIAILFNWSRNQKFYENKKILVFKVVGVILLAGSVCACQEFYEEICRSEDSVIANNQYPDKYSSKRANNSYYNAYNSRHRVNNYKSTTDYTDRSYMNMLGSVHPALAAGIGVSNMFANPMRQNYFREREEYNNAFFPY